MNVNIRRYSLLLILTFLIGNPLFSAPLTLENYLSQVTAGHEGVKALSETKQGALERSHEGRLLTSPQVFANLQWASDSRITTNPAFQGTRTSNDSYSLGVLQQFNFGLTSKLYYALSLTDIENAQPTAIPIPKFYEAKPVLEINQSILRNGFGRETRATERLAEAGALASHYADSFKLKLALAEAEGTFWRLAIARQVVEVQKDSLERAKKLKEWNARRVKLELADRSDILQAEAGLQVRQLEYQTALDDLRSASLAFNNLRGKKQSDVPEELPAMDRTITDKIVVPEKKGAREDVKAAEQMTVVSAASAEVGYEKNLPTLDVFGSVSLNGRDATRSTAFSDSFKTDHPAYAVGVKFQAPLNFGLTNDARSGYAKEIKASELTFRRKQFEEEEQWNDITKKLAESKEKLRLTFLIEDSQSKKLERERERLKLGRSVTFQVLQFEQDYALSQMMRLKTQGEVLGLSAQLRTYGESK